jgi:predicted  nucleic acid-binding Zn-ribbon protein
MTLPMHADLEKLIQLQRAETDLKRAQAELAETPRLKAELDARLAAERTRLDDVRAALATSQKTQRQHETEVVDLKSKLSKYKGQLMEVKNNKEYTAMLHEIEAVEREIRSREDQILAEMERAENLAAQVKQEEGVFKAAEESAKGERRALEERSRALESAVSQHASERDAIAATISTDTLELFQRVARLRGSGVAEARDGMCQLCHVKVRPQMYVDLKLSDSLLQCASCSRILYYMPPVPVVVPQP